MFAIIETGGKQYKVATGDTLKTEKIPAKVGETIELPSVLMVSDDKDIRIEKNELKDVKVLAEVIAEGKSKKVTVFKMKRRKNYRRTRGHRQQYTTLRIKEIKV